MKIKTIYSMTVTAVFVMMFALAATAQQSVPQLGAANTVLQNGESVVSTVNRAKSVGKSFAKLAGKKNKVRKTDDSTSDADKAANVKRIEPSSPVPTADRSNGDIRRDARRNRINTGFNTIDADDDEYPPTGEDENEIRQMNRQTRPRTVKIE